MKKIVRIILVSFFFAGSLCAQDTKYVIVPIKIYKNNKVDIYGLSSLTNRLFAEAGYQVFTENRASWPNELQQNPCLAIYTETEDVSPFIGLTKVKLTLKDCYQQLLFETVGKDNDMDDIKALHFALKEAFENTLNVGELQKSYAKISTKLSSPQHQAMKQTSPEQANKPIAKENKIAPTAKTTQLGTASKEAILKKHWKKYSPIEIEGIYTYEGVVYFVEYADENFQFSTQNTVIAELEKTSKQGVYKVFWTNGNFDIAYRKANGILLVEQTQGQQVRLLQLQRK